jgi:hypothetical protein
MTASYGPEAVRVWAYAGAAKARNKAATLPTEEMRAMGRHVPAQWRSQLDLVENAPIRSMFSSRAENPRASGAFRFGTTRYKTGIYLGSILM